MPLPRAGSRRVLRRSIADPVSTADAAAAFPNMSMIPPLTQWCEKLIFESLFYTNRTDGLSWIARDLSLQVTDPKPPLPTTYRSRCGVREFVTLSPADFHYLYALWGDYTPIAW